MAVPNSRDEFKHYCLRKLGAPVINIDVSEDQIEDRIDEALKYYADYHFDATEKIYYKHQITAEDKQNGYITLPENIIGAVNIFDIGGLIANNIFNINYQIALNDLYTLTSVSMVPYYMSMSHISFLQEMLVGKQPIRFQRHNNKLYIDTNWERFLIGEYIIVEAYEVIDPDEFTDVWGDRWLARYCSQLIKKQWGTNTKKFTGLKLPNGAEINGQQIYDEAVEELEQLERETWFYAPLNVDFIG